MNSKELQGKLSPGGKIIHTKRGETFAGLGIRPVDPRLSAVPVQDGARATLVRTASRP